MSSLRNATQRRTHRERAQPLERQKLGLLEKHKDYSLRAKDFAEKKARLRILRQKATDRNPDEFHFAMMSSRVDKDGVKVAERGNKSLSHDVVKLLKTQDAGYLRTMAMKARKERERLEEEIQLVDQQTADGRNVELRALKGETNGRAGRHKVFVDDQQTLQDFTAEAWFETDHDGLNRSYNRPRRRTDIVAAESTSNSSTPESPRPKTKREKEAEFLEWKEQRSLQKKHDTDQKRRRDRLEAVKEREKNLLLAEQELDYQRAQMSNSTGGVNKNGVKFKRRLRKK